MVNVNNMAALVLFLLSVFILPHVQAVAMPCKWGNEIEPCYTECKKNWGYSWNQGCPGNRVNIGRVTCIESKLHKNVIHQSKIHQIGWTREKHEWSNLHKKMNTWTYNMCSVVEGAIDVESELRRFVKCIRYICSHHLSIPLIQSLSGHTVSSTNDKSMSLFTFRRLRTFPSRTKPRLRVSPSGRT